MEYRMSNGLEPLSTWLRQEQAEGLKKNLQESFCFDTTIGIVITSRRGSFNIYVDWNTLTPDERIEYRYPIAVYANAFLDGWTECLISSARKLINS